MKAHSHPFHVLGFLFEQASQYPASSSILLPVELTVERLYVLTTGLLAPLEVVSIALDNGESVIIDNCVKY